MHKLLIGLAIAVTLILVGAGIVIVSRERDWRLKSPPYVYGGRR